MARNYRLALKIEQRNKDAQRAEQDNHIDKAIQLYEQNIKEDYADEFAFERLMILYRKEKEYKEELRVIRRGIEVFKQSMKEHLKHSLSRHVDSKKLEQLSNAILKSSKYTAKWSTNVYDRKHGRKDSYKGRNSKTEIA